MSKRLSPIALQALQDALTHIYWYKQDLKRFLIAGLGGMALVNSALLKHFLDFRLIFRSFAKVGSAARAGVAT